MCYPKRVNTTIQLGDNNFQEIVVLQPSWRYELGASVDRSCATWLAKRNELRCLKTLVYRNAWNRQGFRLPLFATILFYGFESAEKDREEKYGIM